MIVGKNIKKSYGEGELKTEVLKGIDVHVKKGEFIAIMGRSGAGKSTLLYQLSLLDEPTEGDIVVDGKKTQGMDENQRTQFRLFELGYVFQDYAIVPELTAIENILLPLLMKGYENGQARGLAMEALKKVNLEHRANNLPSQLSGGEQQRVSIARAIAHGPKILFADEPTANLDNVTADNVMKIFQELHAQGQTIVMVTHEEEYGKKSDRILILDDGKILREEHPKKHKH